MKRSPPWLAPLLALLSLSSSACGPDRALPPEYRALEVPTARLASPAARERGRGLYLEHCALCHGVNADGKGVRQNLSSPPRDFTRPAWHKSTTPRQIYFVIQEGKPGTAMPAWKVLTPEETWDVVGYLLGLGRE